MPYTKQTWADGEAGGTPITAAALDNIESGIESAQAAAEAAASRLDTAEATLAAATSAADADSIVRRDANSGFSTYWLNVLAAPSVAESATNKTYVDAADAALDTRLDTAEATLAAATNTGTATTIAKRDASGGIDFTQVNINTTNPTQPYHAARKSYVDAADAALDTRLDTAEATLAAATSSSGTTNTLVKRNASGEIAVANVYLPGGTVPTQAYVDTQVATKVGAYDTGLATIRKMTQAAYDALGTKNAATLYVIQG